MLGTCVVSSAYILTRRRELWWIKQVILNPKACSLQGVVNSGDIGDLRVFSGGVVFKQMRGVRDQSSIVV
jgi:hypothetical protein